MKPLKWALWWGGRLYCKRANQWENSVMTHFSPPVRSFCHVHLRPIWLHNHSFRELNFFEQLVLINRISNALRAGKQVPPLLSVQIERNGEWTVPLQKDRLQDETPQSHVLVSHLSSLCCHGCLRSFEWHTIMIVSSGKEDQLAQAWLWTHRSQHESEVQPAGSAAGLLSGGRVWPGPENHLWSKSFSPEETVSLVSLASFSYLATIVS